MKKSFQGYAAAPVRWVVMLCLLFVVGVASTANGQRVVKVGVYDNKPMVFLDEDGQAAGIDVEVIKEIARKNDWKLEFVYGTWEECLDRLEKGEIDVQVDIGYSKERSQRFDFNDEDIFSTWAVVYGAPD